MSTPPLYRDPDAPRQARVEDLLSRMTLDEKLSQLLHEAAAVPRLGIPAYDWWSEALHGVARNGVATVFPEPIGLAASFDPALLQRIGSAVGDEARAKHHAAAQAGRRGRYQGLTVWCPNINIFRDPRWGRGQETYGEDPVLTGTLGAAYVRGLQGDHPHYLKVAACAKHYAVHSGPEKLRHCFDARVSAQDLWETYLPAFRMLVAAGVEAVMGAYNRVNGEPCCGSKTLLQDILRTQWGFQGHVVSDCWAIRDFHEHHKVTQRAPESAALAINNGCDLNCGCTFERLADAIAEGLVTEATIDRALRRLLMTRFKLGMFDPPERVPYTHITLDVVNCPAHRALARQAAANSVVLLKNHNALLPLPKNIRSLALVGPHAANVDVLLGNYYGLSTRMVTLLEGILAKVDKACNVQYRPGCLSHAPNLNPLDWAVGEAALADVIIAVLGLSPLMEGEEGDAIASASMGDRERIELPPHQTEFLRKLKATGKPVVLILTGGAPLAIPEEHELADAIVMAWYPGEEGGNGVADVLFGDVNPSGRLPVTFPRATTQLPPFEDYAMNNRTYRFMREEPLYPFGFGLSYTTFSYVDPQLTPPRIARNGSTTATVWVKNTGPRAGEEIVQLYLSDCEATVRVPQYALKAFQRVALAPGETRPVQFEITPEMLALIDLDGTARVEPGLFRVIIGGACPHPRSQALGAAPPALATLKVE
ncbi:MAG: glycoside hydrolase family 3 C-terminal domain-containing protein [bacterium]|nr:glycoside hydrolase family 3 C-terminal domain-containing protein [bacterium]